MNNEILEELWKIKDQIAHEYDYDIKKLAEDLRNKETESETPVINMTSQAKLAIT